MAFATSVAANHACLQQPCNNNSTLLLHLAIREVFVLWHNSCPCVFCYNAPVGSCCKAWLCLWTPLQIPLSKLLATLQSPYYRKNKNYVWLLLAFSRSTSEHHPLHILLKKQPSITCFKFCWSNIHIWAFTFFVFCWFKINIWASPSLYFADSRSTSEHHLLSALLHFVCLLILCQILDISNHLHSFQILNLHNHSLPSMNRAPIHLVYMQLLISAVLLPLILNQTAKNDPLTYICIS